MSRPLDVFLGFAIGLIVAGGMVFMATPQVAPDPAPRETFVIQTRQYECTAVRLDGAWQWPPVCDARAR